MPTTVPHIWRPSAARRIVLDGYAPVPRGTTAAPPAPQVWPTKDPADVLDYEIDISAALAGDTDAISTVDVAVMPADLACSAVAADGNLVVLWLSGGTSGTTYVVSVAICTAGGRGIARALLLPVQSLAAAALAAASLTTAGGQAITDQSGNPIQIGS